MALFDTSLKRLIDTNKESSKGMMVLKRGLAKKVSTVGLWDKAVCTLTARLNVKEIDEALGLSENGNSLSVEEGLYHREGIVALKLSGERGETCCFGG